MSRSRQVKPIVPSKGRASKAEQPDASAALPWQPSKPLERGRAAEQVQDDLRTQILGGRLARGAKLPTERQLADAYGVSGGTIREATRGLVTARLIEVRHGSGAYVTGEHGELVAASLGSMIQMERIGVAQVLGVLGALNSHAAELAARNATAAEVEALRQALRDIDGGASIEAASSGLTRFLELLPQASGNPLLAALCRFLAGVQVGLGVRLSRGSLASWRRTSQRLAEERRAIVEAIGNRDAEAARAAGRKYHERSLKVIAALPDADAALQSDLTLSSVLASLLRQPPAG